MAIFKPFRVKDAEQLFAQKDIKVERVKDIYLDKDNGNTYFVLEEEDILNEVKDTNVFLRHWVPEEIKI